jgi:hypothetical protein
VTNSVNLNIRVDAELKHRAESIWKCSNYGRPSGQTLRSHLWALFLSQKLKKERRTPEFSGAYK